jgi:hypothetical protein
VGRHDVSVHLLDDAEKINSLDSAGQWRDSVAQAGAFISSSHPSTRFWTSTELADEHLALAFDDQRLYSDFAAMLGATPATSDAPAAAATVVIEVLTDTGVKNYGYLRVARSGKPVPVINYFIGYGRADCPYREIGSEGGWTALSDEAGTQSTFLVQDEHCFFRLTETWTIVALSLVFRAAFGFQHDAILFHAAAVIVKGSGFMLAGPRYSGKSTLSLALAARGHHFLSDEIAWYIPSTRHLTAFRRPVGVREGVRSAAIDTRILETSGTGIGWHDSLRLPIDSLVPQEAPRTATLDIVVFLKRFEARPRLVPVHPSLEHLPQLQPTPVSMLNVPPARRMMEMVRLVSSVRMYDLYSGHPDETARMLEEIVHT